MPSPRQGTPGNHAAEIHRADFAYEVDSSSWVKSQVRPHQQFLASIKAPLRRGDVVEVFTDP